MPFASIVRVTVSGPRGMVVVSRRSCGMKVGLLKAGK
jgi:hypothetical protein